MKNRISFQIAAAVSILALLGSAGVSVLYYFRTYSSEVTDSQRMLLQLGQTVRSTASIAAYLNDRELANEVVQGLQKNEIVAAARLTSVTGMSVPSATSTAASIDQIARIKLESPFTPGETVGELLITLRHELINQRARDSAWANAAMLGGYTLFVAFLVFLLIQWRFISGIKQIASSLNHITPGEKERLVHPAKHQYDEVGGLIDDINRLLGLVQEKLDNERALLGQMESLEKRFRMIYERAGVGIFLMDRRARLVMANPAFQEIIGKDAYARILDQDVNCMIHLFSESDKTFHLLDETFVQGRLSSTDLKMLIPGRQPRWVYCLLTQVRDDSGAPSTNSVFIQGIITDISERKQEELRIRFQAERDPLTHLLNRRSAEHSLKLLLEKARYDGSCVAVCMADIDGFKPINDKYGHDAGDKVLAETARRLSNCLRNTDLVARLGGDEFLLAIQGANHRDKIQSLLEKLVQSLSEEIDIGGNIRIRISASIGVALSPAHGTEYEQLMTLADRTMYQVKQDGKKGFRFYTPGNSRIPNMESV